MRLVSLLPSLWFALPLAAQGWTTVQTIPVNPRSTFLRTDSTDTLAAGAVVVDLGALGIKSADRIRLRTTGSFQWNSGSSAGGTQALAVFTFTNAGLLPATAANRFLLASGNQAIGCNAPGHVSALTHRESLATDVPEDFLVDTVAGEVRVPSNNWLPQSPFLRLMAYDTFWGDNTDPENDFGVVLERWVDLPRTWTLAAAGPFSPRAFAAAAFDEVRGEGVLFGGSYYFDFPWSVRPNETWIWNGANWSLRTTTSAPAARLGHAMAYDSLRGVVVLFGGVGANYGVFNDTWEFDGADWIQRQPAVNATGVCRTAMAYDRTRGRCVLFGGNRNNIGGAGGVWNLSNETWEWDGVNWLQRTPAVAPSARVDHFMVWDPLRQRVTLGTGFPVAVGNWNPIRDHWEWDGSNWTIRGCCTFGSAYGATAFSDLDRAIWAVYGGSINGIMELRGCCWSPGWNTTPPTPPALVKASSFYDTWRGVGVLVGGLTDWVVYANSDQTWVYGPPQPSTSVVYGQACGPAPQPNLVVTNRPVAGDTFRMNLNGVSPTALPFLNIGLSQADVPLAQVTPLAYADCRWRVNALTNEVVLGRSVYELAIPGGPSLLGLPLYMQLAQFEQTNNRISLSNPVYNLVGSN